MTLKRALEILTQDLKDQFNSPVFGLNVAKGLGIEALRRIIDTDNQYPGSKHFLLPGETEE